MKALSMAGATSCAQHTMLVVLYAARIIACERVELASSFEGCDQSESDRKCVESRQRSDRKAEPRTIDVARGLGVRVGTTAVRSQSGERNGVKALVWKRAREQVVLQGGLGARQTRPDTRAAQRASGRAYESRKLI